MAVLAHGFFDSVWLAGTIKNFPNLEAPIHPAEYYYIQGRPGIDVAGGLDRTFKFGCNGPDGLSADSCQWHPRVNVFASIAAIFLLAAGPVLMDDEQTLLGMQPL